MYTKHYCCWVLGLCASLWLLTSQVLATPLPDETTKAATAWLADGDSDGVDDAVDLCPGTPGGVAVNAYGCPLALATCDYTTATVTLTPAGGSSGTAVTTRYVLASNTGTILQINPSASFTGLSGTATYMALAVTYEEPISNLLVGNALSAVSAACYDWSDALVFKACVAPTGNCDYQIGDQIVLQATGGSEGIGVKTSYVLTDAAGTLVQVSATPVFASAGLTSGTYNAYSLTYTDDGTIMNLTANGTTTLGQVTADCLAISPALPLMLCGCPPRCLPILVVRVR